MKSEKSPAVISILEKIKQDTEVSKAMVSEVMGRTDVKIFDQSTHTHPYPAIIRQFIMEAIYNYNTVIFADENLSRVDRLHMIIPPVTNVLIKSAITKACKNWDDRETQSILEFER